MVIVFVYQNNLQAGVFQFIGQTKSAKTSTNNNNTLFTVLFYIKTHNLLKFT